MGAFSLEQLCVVPSGSVQPTGRPWGAAGGHRGPVVWPRCASVFGVRETAPDEVVIFLGGTQQGLVRPTQEAGIGLSIQGIAGWNACRVDSNALMAMRG